MKKMLIASLILISSNAFATVLTVGPIQHDFHGPEEAEITSAAISLLCQEKGELRVWSRHHMDYTEIEITKSESTANLYSFTIPRVSVKVPRAKRLRHCVVYLSIKLNNGGILLPTEVLVGSHEYMSTEDIKSLLNPDTSDLNELIFQKLNGAKIIKTDNEYLPLAIKLNQID